MSFLAQLFMQLPSFLIAIGGFVLAAIFMSRARKAAILVIIAAILTLLQSAFSIFNHQVLLELMMEEVISDTTYGIIASGGFTLFYLAISALLLAAAFVGRNEQSTLQPAVAGSDISSATSTPAAHRGALVLILGLLGLLLFAPLGIAAWILASNDLNAMRQGSMDNSGEGMTLAGKILGIIATALMLLGVLIFLGAMAVLAGSDWRF